MYYKARLKQLGDRIKTLYALKRFYVVSPFVAKTRLIELEKGERVIRETPTFEAAGSDMVDVHSMYKHELDKLLDFLEGSGTTLIIEEYKSEEETEREKRKERYDELKKWHDNLSQESREKVDEWTSIHTSMHIAIAEEDEL